MLEESAQLTISGPVITGIGQDTTEVGPHDRRDGPFQGLC